MTGLNCGLTRSSCTMTSQLRLWKFELAGMSLSCGTSLQLRLFQGAPFGPKADLQALAMTGWFRREAVTC
jgi:hypothetical protein